MLSFVVGRLRRVEPRSAQRARKEDGTDRAMGELSEQASHNRDAVGWGLGYGPRVGLVPRPTLG